MRLYRLSSSIDLQKRVGDVEKFDIMKCTNTSKKSRGYKKEIITI